MSHYPRTVELQEYAIAAITHFCPCLGQMIKGMVASPDARMVRLIGEAEEHFSLAIPDGDLACREVTISCPKNMRDLFYRTPHTQLGSRVVHLLGSSYESWLKGQGLTHPLQLRASTLDAAKECLCQGNHNHDGECPRKASLRRKPKG